ncbi:hypothetical protein [Alicyclobacillus ferrooxydans]|uniref:Ferritin-like domain-containing protein n=1 Tax=Alicyclobacillus ferrooxydans TaxID=471514 RepID=A0A0P9F2M8_9BACL|nr:hypothetical protein [Alicyclobacillus ferrooxydans]KPV45631.1 hypothetical protein AN477_01570 [Alicyclobacillus ferrooxydans]
MFRAYTISQQDLDDRLHIYEKARKAYDWNPKHDISWNDSWGFKDSELEFAWNLASQSVSAEEVGMLVAAKLLTEADDAPSRLCLATAVSDEAKHCEVFSRFALLCGGNIKPPDPARDDLLDTLLGLNPTGRFLVHTLLEGLASDEFAMFRRAFQGTILDEIYQRVIQDESRHVAMGIEYLKWAVERMNDDEIQELREHSKRIYDLTGIDQPGAFNWLGKLIGQSPDKIQKTFILRNRSRLNLILSRKGVKA